MMNPFSYLGGKVLSGKQRAEEYSMAEEINYQDLGERSRVKNEWISLEKNWQTVPVTRFRRYWTFCRKNNRSFLIYRDKIEPR